MRFDCCPMDGVMKNVFRRRQARIDKPIPSRREISQIRRRSRTTYIGFGTSVVSRMSEPESETEGETITIHELLERSARTAPDLQREDGSFPPGQNGVYDEPETPVRTTSH